MRGRPAVASEKNACDLVLLHPGTKEDGMTALLREVTGLGRAEAHRLLANLPQPVAQGLAREAAAALCRHFEGAGATVTLR